MTWPWTRLAWCPVAGAAAGLVLLGAGRRPDGGWDRPAVPEITAASAMRIRGIDGERLPVFKVTYGGETVLTGDVDGGGPTGRAVRVDVEIGGQWLTVWVR